MLNNEIAFQTGISQCGRSLENIPYSVIQLNSYRSGPVLRTCIESSAVAVFLRSRILRSNLEHTKVGGKQTAKSGPRLLGHDLTALAGIGGSLIDQMKLKFIKPGITVMEYQRQWELLKTL